MDLTFEEEAVEHILASFDAKVNADGYVVDRETDELIPNPEGEPIERDELAIVEDGSTIFVDDNFDSLVKHVERQR